jgi:hypothetical protein
MGPSEGHTQSDLKRDEQPATPDEAKAAREKEEPTVSRPGAFKNDPDDPTNPNEAIERARRQVRP